MTILDSKYILSCKNSWKKLQLWYQTRLGKILYQGESELLIQALEDCFGYHLIQLGSVAGDIGQKAIETVRVKNKTIIQCFNEGDNQSSNSLVSLFQRLPIKSNSVDAVIIYHSLEFEAHPHEILREVERILVAEGKLIIIAFNPYSLLGIWYRLQQLKNRLLSRPLSRNRLFRKEIVFPIHYDWISQKRLLDWLALLGFDVERLGGTFFRPPINNESVLNRLKFMDPVGQKYWPFIAGSFIYKATKRVSTLTPLKQKWQLKEKVMGVSVAESSNRNMKKNRE